MLKNVPNGGFAELLVNPGDGPTLITNMDTNATLVLGKDNSVLAKTISGGFQTGGDISLIHPNGSRIVDGKTAVYAIGTQASGTILVDVHQGAEAAPASATEIVSQLVLSTLPALVASAVQAAGVPPIDIPAAVFISLGTDIPASPNSVGTGHITLSKYQSYTLIMKVGNGHNNVNTNPYCRVTFAWSLAADNFDPIHVEDWIVPIGPFSFTFNYTNYGAGPCYSDTLDITFSSYDTVVNTFILGVFGSFRTRQRSIMRGQYHWLAGGAPNEAQGLGTDGILASASGTNLAVGASTTPLLVNLWHGKASLYLQSADAAVDDLECHIQPQPVSALPNSPDIVLTMDGSGNFSRLTNIDLPRRACIMFFKNTGQVIIPSFSADLVMEGVSE